VGELRGEEHIGTQIIRQGDVFPVHLSWRPGGKAKPQTPNSRSFSSGLYNPNPWPYSL